MAGSKTEKQSQSGETETKPDNNQPSNDGKSPTTEQVERQDLFATRKKANVKGFDMSKLSIKKNLTKQLFSIAHSKQLVCKVTSEIYDRKMPMAGRSKLEEADTKLVDIINIETGEEGALICNTLIVKAFEEASGPLVGRLFAIREGGIKEGKKYRSIDMVELSE